MTFEFSWLATPVDRDWHYIGVLVLGGDTLGFHPIAGFEIPGQSLVEVGERATVDGQASETWSYFMDRGGIGLSSFSEPDSIEADDHAAAVRALMEVIPAAR